MKYYDENTERGPLLVVVVAVCVMLLFACDSEAGDYVYVHPYIEIGAGYAPDKTPWSTQMGEQHYDWKGSNPVFIGSAGVEIYHPILGKNNHLDIGGTHISNWFQGVPFNNKAETSLDMIHIKYRWRF